MSYDMTVWEGDAPLDDEDRRDILVAIGTVFLEGRVGQRQPPPQIIADFIDALLRRWPNIGEEGSPWTSSVGAHLNGPVLRLDIDWDRAVDVAPGVVELAKRHGLQCYGGSTKVPWILR
ncbi:hypothetical protein [Nocardia lijiangensis]|uniref:hypothetical protein n=1 Tax=Nocardia lijiangensis TaxID=299618 RepID=UPI003D72E111